MAFQRVLERYKNIQDKYIHQIVKSPYTVKEEQQNLLDLLSVNGQSTFEFIFGEIQSRMQAIVRFLALLELVNAQQLEIIDGLDKNNFWIDVKSSEEE